MTSQEIRLSAARRHFMEVLRNKFHSFSDQEIRNAVAPPRIRRFFALCAENQNFQMMLGKPNDPIRLQEAVLRFLLFMFPLPGQIPQNTTEALDRMFLHLCQASSKELARYAQTFQFAAHTVPPQNASK